jgi:hypothetical protein
MPVKALLRRPEEQREHEITGNHVEPFSGWYRRLCFARGVEGLYPGHCCRN